MVGGIPELLWGLQAHRSWRRRSGERGKWRGQQLAGRVQPGGALTCCNRGLVLGEGVHMLGEGSLCWGRGPVLGEGTLCQEWMQEKR